MNSANGSLITGPQYNTGADLTCAKDLYMIDSECNRNNNYWFDTGREK